MDSRCVVLADAAATAALGAELAQRWLQRAPADGVQILLLEGTLGAGKTSLVQGIAAADRKSTRLNSSHSSVSRMPSSA